MSSHLDYEINKELGECYLFMSELDKAESYYQKAMDSNSELTAPYLGLATIAMQRNQIDVALDYYTKASKIELCDKSLAGIGLVYVEQGKSEDAFVKFQESLEINPNNAVALACLIRICYLENKVGEAIPFLEKALKVEEKDSTIVTLAGCYITVGRNEEAEKLLTDLVVVDPTNKEAVEILHFLQNQA